MILVVVAVLAGALVMSSADRRQPVWAVSRDVAAGVPLRAADLESVDVRLGSAGSAYVSSREAVVGRAAAHDLTAGQLLPRAELAAPQQGVTVTLPIPATNTPELKRSDRITVWISTKQCRAVPILSGVAVQEVSQAGGGFSGGAATDVVVTVPAADAQRVASALDLDGVVLRAGLLGAGQAALPVTSDIGQCMAGASGTGS